MNFIKTISNHTQFARYYLLPKSVEEYRKLIIWRCGNLGMKELDVLVGRWARRHADSLSYEECKKFDQDVLSYETPDLYKYLISLEKNDSDLNDKDNEYLIRIKNDIQEMKLVNPEE